MVNQPRGDRKYDGWRWWLQLLASFLAVGFVVAAFLVLRDQQHQLSTQQDTIKAQQRQIQAGRRTSLGVACAVESAVAEAGRQTLANATPLPPGVEELLVAHGFPLFTERKAQAQIAADAYVQRISDAIEHQIGHKGDRLLNRDGTLNCKQLAHIAHAR